MEENGQIYRVGSWAVKPGQAEAFIEAWQKVAEWIAEKLPGGGEALLL